MSSALSLTKSNMSGHMKSSGAQPSPPSALGFLAPGDLPLLVDLSSAVSPKRGLDRVQFVWLLFSVALAAPISPFSPARRFCGGYVSSLVPLDAFVRGYPADRNCKTLALKRVYLSCTVFQYVYTGSTLGTDKRPYCCLVVYPDSNTSSTISSIVYDVLYDL